MLITVADTGTGMSSEVLAHIFERFYSTKEARGTGLGLVTTREIVTKSGGDIWAETNPGIGTTFFVLLPWSARQPVHTDRPHLSEVPGSPETRILVVEDDPDARRCMVRTLEHKNYTVLVAASPHQAEALADAGELIDVVLIDIVLPACSGIDLARRILTRQPKACVVYVSGYDPGALVLVPDRDSFLPKPFGPSELLDCVREALARRKR